jgi:two-component system response regulator MprA
MLCRVLIVEDQADLREMMAQMLTLEGFDAETAIDGVDALGKLLGSGLQPQIILLDMMMPRMDGWAFVDRQTNNPAIAGIPVVVLSAVPRDQLQDVRAVAVLQKPLNFDDLLSILRALTVLRVGVPPLDGARAFMGEISPLRSVRRGWRPTRRGCSPRALEPPWHQ